MTVYEKAPPPEDPPQELSEEEMQRIAEASQKLIGKDKQVQATCVALLYAQQLYHAGLAALRRRCEELQHEDRAIESHLIASMKEASLRPFSREDLVKKTQGMILPWLAAEIAAEREREQKERREQESQYEESRRQELFRLPWSTESDGDWFLDKERGLILAGEASPVRAAIAEALARAKAEQVTGRRFVVCHLVLGADNIALSKRNRGKLDYLRIPTGQWVDRLTNARQMGKILWPWLKYTRKHRVDLLLVDDIRRTAKPISSAVVASQHLQANYRVLRRWCEEFGAFLLGGAVFEEPPDLQESAWEILDTRSELRFVSGGPDKLFLQTLQQQGKTHE